MPPNMMNALSGSSVKVTGSSNATVKAGPMPGRTPTAVPSVTPANAHKRCGTVSAARKPSARACSVSMRIYKVCVICAICGLHPARQHTGRQRDLQHARKYHIGANREKDGGDRVAHGMTCIKGAGGEPEEDDGRDHEARRFNQDDTQRNGQCDDSDCTTVDTRVCGTRRANRGEHEGDDG